MGSWGFEMNQNDSSADVLLEVKEAAAPTAIAALERAINSIGPNRNDEILGLADWLISNTVGWEALVRHRRAIESVIRLERSPDTLSRWDEPEKRIQALNKFESGFHWAVSLQLQEQRSPSTQQPFYTMGFAKPPRFP